MRKTNINKDIARTDIKVGDKILISREATVKKVRETTIYGGAGKPRKPITIVDTDAESMGITAEESVKLLERDKPSEIRIPLTAKVIYWKDTEDYEYYARRDSVSQEWTVANDHGLKFTTEALIKEIEDESGEFDTYKEGTFEVLKHNYANGGFIPGTMIAEGALNKLREQMGRSIVAPARNVPPTSWVGGF